MVGYVRSGGLGTAWGSGSTAPGYDLMQEYARFVAERAQRPENRIAALEAQVAMLSADVRFLKERVSSLENRIEGGEDTLFPSTEPRDVHEFYYTNGAGQRVRVTVQDA